MNIRSALVLSILSAALQLSAASPENLWMHLSFDGTTDAMPDTRVRAVLPKAETYSYEQGMCGSAISLPAGKCLSFQVDTAGFPSEKGCLILRYKPYAEWDRDVFLLEFNWASFEVQGDIAYFTGKASELMRYWIPSPAAKRAFAGRWHTFIMQWDGPERKIFLDGKLVSMRKKTTPLKIAPGTGVWHFGYNAGEGGKNPHGFANAAYDEFAVLSCTLTEKEIRELTAGKSVLDLIGLREWIKMPRKVFLRHETVEIGVTSLDPEKEIELTAERADGKIISLAKRKAKDFPLTFPASELHEGIYTLRAGSARDWIAVRERIREDFPIGIGGMPLDAEYLEKNHISFMTGAVDLFDRDILDRMFRHGIGYFPNLNVIEIWIQSRAHNRMKKEPYFRIDKESGAWKVNPDHADEYLQKIVPLNGDPEKEGGTSSCSPFSPIALDMMKGALDFYMDAAGDHPGWVAVSFQDEVALRTGRWNPLNKYRKTGWKDEWHCLAMTWKDDVREVYLDGARMARGENIAPGTLTGDWRIGFLPGFNAPNSDSVYDDLGVLSHALSEEECKTIFKEKNKPLDSFGFTRDCLWAYWNFDGSFACVPAERMKKSALTLPETAETRKAEADDNAEPTMDADLSDAAEEQPNTADGILRTEPFVAGKTGKAIDLREKTYLTISVQKKDFPRQEGSLVLWFKPHKTLPEMEEAAPYFFFDTWASFCLSLGNSYFTTVASQFVKWPALIPSYGDYSVYARKYFKEKTGLDYVWPVEAEPGTVFPDGEPYIRWAELMGLPGDCTGEGFDRVYEKLSDHIHARRPDIRTTNYSGCEFGYLDAIGDWNYPYLFEGKSFNGGCAGHSLLDYSFARHRARQKFGAEKPLWAFLGWWVPTPDAPGWWPVDFRINTEIAFASGVQSIEWFCPGSIHPEKSVGYLNHPEGRKEFERWTNWLYDHGPMMRHLKPAAPTAAMLFSDANSAGMMRRTPGYRPDAHRVFTALRTLGVDPVLLTDEAITRAGIPDTVKGLVLTDISYAKESVWKKIEAFAASGGNVFYDEKTKLRPASAVPLGFAYDKTSKEPSYPENHMTALSEIAELLGKTIPPELRSSLFRLDEPTHLLVPFRLDGGEAKFIFLVNTNWKKSTECTFTVTAPGVLYDFLAKKEVPKKNTFAVEPGDWRVFLLLPEKISGVALDASVEGGKLRLSASLNGSKAPLPFRFRILAPDGSVLPSSRSASFDPEGKWREEILLSGKMDPPGEYTFELEELASGTKTQMKFRR